MIDQRIQPGPCVGCGATNYPLSFGGPTVCGPCDCGVSPEITKLRAELSEVRDRCIDSSFALNIALDLPFFMTDKMRERGQAVIDRLRTEAAEKTARGVFASRSLNASDGKDSGQ